jgi:hypothetical protein
MRFAAARVTSIPLKNLARVDIDVVHGGTLLSIPV